MITDKLCPIVLAGVVALAVPSVAGAGARGPLGLSPADCAASWSGLSSAAQRAAVAADRPRRAEILTTGAPSCVIHFLLSGKRVLTATSIWNAGGARHWQLALRPHSWIDGGNARLLPGGKLRASGSDANVHLPVRPSPTIATCVAAWNTRGVSALRAFAGKTQRPVAIAADRAAGGLVVGVVSSGSGGSKPSIVLPPQACVVALSAREVVGSWSDGGVTRWHTLAKSSATVVHPNARLLPNGTLRRG